MRLLSNTLLTLGRPDGRAEGSLLRKAIVATPPRRSVLLLTLFFAFLACVLVGFAGARTALAQEQPEPKDQLKEPPKDQLKEPPKDQPKEPPKDQPKEPPKDQPKEPPKDQPKEQPSFTASCDIDPNNPSQYVISWSGTGWPPNTQIDITIRSADNPDQDPLASGGLSGSFSGSETYSGIKYGREPILIAQGGGGGGKGNPYAEARVSCPELPNPPGPTPPDGNGDNSNSDNGNTDNGVIDVFSGLFAGELPDTGGGWAILLIAGAALIALGWLLVRLARRFAAR
jgi:LPXTG-motif cell wall-anchored protein